MSEVVQMTPELREVVHDAIRNEHHATFWIGDKDKGGREFPIKDLSYDDYMEFLELSKPIIGAIIELVQAHAKDGELDMNLDFSAFTPEKIISLAGANLPRLAWICARQSDPDLSLEDVKRLARRPWNLVTPIVAQVKHNELAKEIMDFFLNAPSLVSELIPDLGELNLKIPATASTTGATR